MWERWRPVWQLAVTQTGREYQLHKHIFFQTVWRCHKQFPDPALAPHSCTSHPFMPGSCHPDLTDLLHVCVHGCSAKCTCKAGTNLCLLKLFGCLRHMEMSVHTLKQGRSVCSQATRPKARPGAPPSTDLAAVTSSMCLSSPWLSPRCLCPAPGLEPSLVAPWWLSGQESHWYPWRATWKWDSRLCKLVLNFDWMIDCF